jgi:hypothetical protein
VLVSRLSVLARRFEPRTAVVSAGSANWTSAPARCSSSTTNRQPVVASTATSTRSPAQRRRNVRRVARSAGAIRPVVTSPVAAFRAS